MKVTRRLFVPHKGSGKEKKSTSSGCPCCIFLRGHIHICLIYLLVFLFPALSHNIYRSLGCTENIQKFYLCIEARFLSLYAHTVGGKVFHYRKTPSPLAQSRGRPPCISHSSLVVRTALGSSLYLVLGSEKCPVVGGWTGHGRCWERKGGWWRHLCRAGMQLMGLQHSGPQREEQTLTS